MANGPVRRTPIGELGLPTGKKARLQRIIYQFGLKNGTAMFLPYDQGLEHGPRDFLDNPASGDPGYILKLAIEGGFNGVAVQIGTAEKFFWDYAGEVPLVLKLNGKTEIPPADAPRSPLNGSVEDAVRLGADVVKVNFPNPGATEGVPKAYARQITEQEGVNAVVRSAVRTPVLLSGGERGGRRGGPGQGADSDGGRRPGTDLRSQHLATRTRRIPTFRRPLAGTA